MSIIVTTTITITSNAPISVSSFSASVSEAVSTIIPIPQPLPPSSSSPPPRSLLRHRTLSQPLFLSILLSNLLLFQGRGSGIDNGAGGCSCSRSAQH
ncbi:hypothetical protein DY000_02009995 [Brassica cretica]|uniref:Uncharacterized protein n=1 Tax=Brassica cretica TaxID=69181 RepID=A0ABQ7C9F3_BRACR|nr:hypothetical protein DY000_02009995 [Brassica cretica]